MKAPKSDLYPYMEGANQIQMDFEHFSFDSDRANYLTKVLKMGDIDAAEQNMTEIHEVGDRWVRPATGNFRYSFDVLVRSCLSLITSELIHLVATL